MSTPHPQPHRWSKGFTLVEVMIGATLGSLILLGVLTAFLFMGRSGANLANYNDMESQGRKMLEYFAEDTRQASAITWTSSTSVTLTVNSASVTYSYSSATQILSRQDSTQTLNLVTGITSFSFKAYTITGTEITALSTAAELTTAGKSTKQLQVSLQAARNRATLTTSTNTVISARFILRNKIVTV